MWALPNHMAASLYFAPVVELTAYVTHAMGEPDLELDLAGLKEPKWGNHANRRYADKKACDTKAITGATDGQVDDHFGWNQKVRKKDSQLHYHGRTERLQRARVTMMI